MGIVALDLSKAFDTINHEILIRKLQNFKLGQNTINFLQNYLKDRTLTVRTNIGFSKKHDLAMGVPQGSILGPLLFTLYINDLPGIVKCSKTMLYADDTTVFVSSRFPANIQVNLNKDLRLMEKWFDSNKLKINASKTEYMLVSNRNTRRRFEHIKIQVNKQLIPEKDAITILGVTIGNDLSWDMHTAKLIGNLKHRFRSFSRSCKLLTIDSRKLLYNAAIASRLNYCDVIWDKCKQSSINKLQTIQNRCARKIMDSPPGASALPVIRDLGWLMLAEKRKLHKCVLLHELLLGNGPQILVEELHPWTNRHSRVTRGTMGENLAMVAHRTNYFGKSFFNDTARIWNTLPLELRQVQNRKTFKEKLHRYFLTT